MVGIRELSKCRKGNNVNVPGPPDGGQSFVHSYRYCTNANAIKISQNTLYVNELNKH